MTGEIKSVEDLIVYQKSKGLFKEFIDEEIGLWEKSVIGRTLLNNQIRCLDSICANMEEGFERKFGKETQNFFRISRGSCAEALGRYKRLENVLPKDILQKRISILKEVRAMLHALILRLY